MPPTPLPSVTSQIVDWAARVHTLAGYSECGDAFVMAPFPQGMLAAVIDGLGHGSEAATAARIAVATLEEHAGLPVTELMKNCHDALRKTRGAVISLASFDVANDTVTWLGVGNVEGMLFRAGEARQGRESLLLRGGVAGYQIPSLRAATLPVFPGDLLVFVTDGIDNRFCEKVSPWQAPDAIAADILSLYVKGTDDALVLVTRYLGKKA
jgi:hypothetical protein